MSMFLVVFAFFVAAVLGTLLLSSVREGRSKAGAASGDDLAVACRHVANFPQIRQALDAADLQYIEQRSGRAAARAIRAERRRVALSFLEGLYADYSQIMTTATLVAAYSPEIDAREESRRFRLSLKFRLQYFQARLRFAFGFANSANLADLAAIVGSLALDLERVVNEIAAAAALAQSQNPSAQS